MTQNLMHSIIGLYINANHNKAVHLVNVGRHSSVWCLDDYMYFIDVRELVHGSTIGFLYPWMMYFG